MKHSFITLQNLPLGSVIEHRGKRYYKAQGMDGDVLLAENDHGHWLFVTKYDEDDDSEPCIHWKTFKILFTPDTP